MSLRIGVILAILMSVVIGIAGTLYLEIEKGTRQVDSVFQSSLIVDQMQGIQPSMVRLLAYTQLVSKGDESYDAALRQQLTQLESVLTQLDARAKGLGARQWSLTQESLNHWGKTREAASELLELPLASLEQRGPALNQLVEESTTNIQQTLSILDAEVRNVFQERVQKVNYWRQQLTVKAALWVGALLAAAGVLVLLIAVTIDRPLADLRKLVTAVAKRDFSFRLKPRNQYGLKEVFEAFNQLAAQAQGQKAPDLKTPQQPLSDEAGFFQDLERTRDIA